MTVFGFAAAIPGAIIGLVLLAFALWGRSADKGLRLGAGIVGGVLAAPSIVLLGAFAFVMLTAHSGP